MEGRVCAVMGRRSRGEGWSRGDDREGKELKTDKIHRSLGGGTIYLYLYLYLYVYIYICDYKNTINPGLP